MPFYCFYPWHQYFIFAQVKKSKKLDKICFIASVHCDQIGRFIGLWATFYINLPKSPTFLCNFCKGVKICHFIGKSFLGNFYRQLAIFFWSHCISPTRQALLPLALLGFVHWSKASVAFSTQSRYSRLHISCTTSSRNLESKSESLALSKNEVNLPYLGNVRVFCKAVTNLNNILRS